MTDFNMADPALIYYGPYACDECYASDGGAVPAVMITKVSREQGDATFDYPDGPIYPNTVWAPHVHRISESPTERSGCVVEDHVSRCCEYGSLGCAVRHLSAARLRATRQRTTKEEQP